MSGDPIPLKPTPEPVSLERLKHERDQLLLEKEYGRPFDPKELAELDEIIAQRRAKAHPHAGDNPEFEHHFHAKYQQKLALEEELGGLWQVSRPRQIAYDPTARGYRPTELKEETIECIATFDDAYAAALARLFKRHKDYGTIAVTPLQREPGKSRVTITTLDPNALLVELLHPARKGHATVHDRLNAKLGREGPVVG